MQLSWKDAVNLEIILVLVIAMSDEKRQHLVLTAKEKTEIVAYQRENDKLTHENIANFFAGKWKKACC